MGLINFSSITQDDRQRIIIEFIRSKPYCNVEDVVRGVKNDISRVTVFKILHKLIESGAVRRHLENNQKRNSREHKLFVDEGNPLVSVRLELEKFESEYFDLLNKVMFKFEPERIRVSLNLTDYEASRMPFFLQGMLSQQLLHVFYFMVDAYLFRFLLIWSQKISDQQVLQQLYSLVFSKIADMHTRQSETLNSWIGENINLAMTLFVRERLRGLGGQGPLVVYLDWFKKFGMEKEIEPVIDSLWKITGELQPDVYPEPRTHGWPFKYGKDDWRKLVNLLRQHRKSTSSRQDSSKYSQNRSGAQT